MQQGCILDARQYEKYEASVCTKELLEVCG